ncbi:RNA polymerase sigma-54 factor [Altericroceibacterium spongiae]|uniref:RNA polymerase sigma-54 factor n=1 Tax=Altericroceibacterium spongiae TaxID=2320269 RepID=A0A420EPX5_9SPHN|nr:RNA polymerase factor sigma-54 [Altericroceibacterium spongiae]RKF22736.1 RNA polymerase sigma-54 factor [Altericroceibacterium spongiae]
MSLAPRLDLRQSQSLVMTPQLQQAIKLLALSNLEIEAFIGDALENNPLLESGDIHAESGENPPLDNEAGDSPTSDELMMQGQGEADAPLDIDPAALDRDHDTGDWSAQAGSASSAETFDIEERGSPEETLIDHLEAQLPLITSDPQIAFIAATLIGQLDESGYLHTPLHETAGELGISDEEAETALKLVQSLDPTGIGARSLGECIALQAREADRYDPCMARLLANLDLVAKSNFAQLKRLCAVDDEDLADMLAELRQYDPKPGLQFGGVSSAPVVPDILITASRDHGWDIALNQETLPRLIVNRPYYVELRSGSQNREAKSWLNEKLADANWLIKALDQRQKTILKVAAEIVKQQDGFFRRGVSELKPLTLRGVAEQIDMHESTVSRVTSNKYLHCDRGTFELKYFFTSGVASADGESSVSAEAVKAQIRALVDAEDPKKVLSDDKLVELLRDKGFDLARRTVAKYREAIGIGSSVQRRRQKKLAMNS